MGGWAAFHVGAIVGLAIKMYSSVLCHSAAPGEAQCQRKARTIDGLCTEFTIKEQLLYCGVHAVRLREEQCHVPTGRSPPFRWGKDRSSSPGAGIGHRDPAGVKGQVCLAQSLLSIRGAEAWVKPPQSRECLNYRAREEFDRDARGRTCQAFLA